MRHVWISLVAALFFVGCGDAAQKKPSDAPSMPQTSMRTLGGETITVVKLPRGLRFSGLEGKVVVLEAFGYRCPPCLASMSGYNRISHDYGDNVAVVAIESWGLDKAALRQLVKERGVRYRVVATSDAGEILAFMEALTGWNLNFGVPYVMIFDQHGTFVSDMAPGMLNESVLRKKLDALLRRK